jgi:hypothetical protein
MVHFYILVVQTAQLSIYQASKTSIKQKLQRDFQRTTLGRWVFIYIIDPVRVEGKIVDLKRLEVVLVLNGVAMSCSLGMVMQGRGRNPNPSSDLGLVKGRSE